MVARQAFSVFALLLTMAIPAGASEEVCVACSGPSAIYRCTIDEASKIAGYRGGKRLLQVACITELAREGGHAECRVKRTGSEGCIGQDKAVSLMSSVEGLAAKLDGETSPQSPSADEDVAASEPPKPGPPKTVEELARRTASASKDQLQKTGNTVGDAMKKSWSCVTSLFKNC